MEETPRQYKKRIDEKWEKNEKNRDELIKQIEEYELVDERFKSRTKKEILENFEKNEKAEKESEQYRIIISELENIDKKYGELAKLKEKLKSNKQEKTQLNKEIRESKLDGSDETTLKMQMASIRKLIKRLETLKTEIEELEKEIENREKEIKEIEKSYGEKTMSSGTEGEESYKGKMEDSSLRSGGQDVAQGEPKTLKEYHEQTVQDLWNKDRTRSKIFEILEEGAGIDDKLKDKIEKEISDRFFEYYDKKKGSLRLKSARYLKNKLKNKEKSVEEIMNIPEGEEKEGKIIEIERQEKAYSGKKSDLRKQIKLREHKRFIEMNGYDELVRKRWKKRITYKNDANNEFQKKMTNALDKILVKVKFENGNRIIEFKLGKKNYKLLVVGDLTQYSDSEYLRGGKLSEKGMIGNNPDDWKNKKLAEYIKEQKKNGFIIPTGDHMRDIAKKVSRLIGNNTYNQNTQISHLMYLISLEGDYRLDEFEECDSGALARVWLGFSYDYDSRHLLYSTKKFEYAKLLMIYNK